jgi:hypothetical protein
VNLYVVVEGRVVEKEVYKAWVPLVNPNLSYVGSLAEVDNNNFVIFSGGGYPQYFDMIRAGLEDVAADAKFTRLVISVDSEDMTLEQKHQEIKEFIQSTGIVGVDYRIVVQHFCFETWALGNRRIGVRNPKNPVLARYKGLYDVVTEDPEDLPPLLVERLNRSQFAEKYLRMMLNDKNKNLSYSKRDPSVVTHPKYFQNIRARMDDLAHILSFRAFLDAFV